MDRIGHIKYKEFRDILGSAETFNYRNKMEYTFSNKRWLLAGEEPNEQMNALGFHVPGRFDKVLNINKCWLQDDLGNTIRNFVRNYALTHQISFYDLREQKGVLRNLILRNSTNGNWMLCLIFAEEFDGISDFMKAIVDEFEQLSSVFYSINTKKNDSIYDLEFNHVAGSTIITQSIENLDFEISPKSFFQTNPKQAENLYKVAFDLGNLSKNDVVYDLYCGTGTLTLFAAKKAKSAVGVESVSEAVSAARRNAKRNNIENVEFVVGDMKDVFNDEFYTLNGKPDVIITDPPRAGMHKNVVVQLLKISAPKIVYISCNPSTQARDLEILSEKYEVKVVQPVDMFPQTHHVECVALLQKK